MQHTPVISSNLASVGYDPDSETLEITFRRSGTYVYDRVPQARYDGLMAAWSKGTYFAYHIKYRYRTAKL
jgi:hypothetical protein